MTQQAYDIYAGEELIDTVHYSNHTVDEVRKACIEHDGYLDDIVVIPHTKPGVVTMTRADKMDQPYQGRKMGKLLHDAYYLQFATNAVVDLVRCWIGEDAVRKSKDPHFNDIPLKKWDRMHAAVMHCTIQLLRRAGDTAPDTLCNSCCIAKAAARRIRGEDPPEQD